MTIEQAMACLVLWRSRRFDTAGIAGLLSLREADVCRVLDAVREHEAGADNVVLRLIEGSAA